MAIKPISKLDPYINSGAVDTAGAVGGNIHLYYISDKDDLVAKLTDPQSYKDRGSNKDQVLIDYDENYFYNLLFEVSKPIDAGKDGLNSNEYSSYKLTYEDLIQNIIVDTKQWLNARNNLGDFDLCALAHRDYFFGGNKTFGGNISVANNLSVHENTVIEGTLDTNSDVSVGGKLTVASTISGGSNISAYGSIYALGALYTGTLSSDVNGTTINPGSNGFTVTGILTGYTSNPKRLDIAVPTNITGNTNITGGLTATNSFFVKSGGIYVNGNSKFSNDITVYGNITVKGAANLTAEHAKWSDLAEYYLGDRQYEPGTLVKFGGKNEVTIADNADGEVNAVVTSKPAFLMNYDLKENPLGCAIALAGRVPVKVIGKVKKFDLIALSEYAGIGAAISREDRNYKHRIIVGRALEPNDNEDVKLVECVVKFNI